MSPRLALLFTDLVESTKLIEPLSESDVALLSAELDRVARDLLAEHGGREIDKSDGFLLLFESASDAVLYARDYHAALRGLAARFEGAILARVGLHVGPVTLRENPPNQVARGAKPIEVDGLAKPTAARVMALALGGQTLATAEAVRAAGITPIAPTPDGRVQGRGTIALSHGYWQLKGLNHPIELFEVGEQGEAPFVPPADVPKAWRVRWQGQAWLPVREVPRNLPAERDAFVGREADLQRLARRIDRGARLVTVLGIGGAGKTRIATRFAWIWLGAYPGGAWFCDLSEARTLDGIVYSVARALDVPLAKSDPVEQLGHVIAQRGRCLVILDNFEQVARHAQATLGKWLDRAHEAVFVVTTREVLGLRGEQALALAPLSTDEGIDLFVARAGQAKHGFAASQETRRHVAELVTLLDGLPLAIELAAARVRLMSPKRILRRMSDRFRLLSSSGGRHTRQATLRATLDWSWDLLSADEQSALAQLAVFEGGFTLEATEAVLDLSDLWAVDAVQGLVDKSLVRQVGDARFDLLVTVQEYAKERLLAMDGRLAAEERHGAHYASFGADETIDALDLHGGTELRRAMVAEIDNLVVACRRSVARGDPDLAVASLWAASEVLGMTGPITPALELGEEVLRMEGLAPEAVVRARRAVGLSYWATGRMEGARAHLEVALACARDHSSGSRWHRRFEGILMGNLGVVHGGQGRLAEARAYLERAVEIHREVGNLRFEGVAISNLGILHLQQGRFGHAMENYTIALAIARKVGDRRSEGVVLGNLGVLHKARNDLSGARARYREALAVHRDVEDRRCEGIVRCNLGIAERILGRPDQALEEYRASLALHREVGNRPYEGNVLGELGGLLRQLGRFDEAQSAYDAAAELLRDVGDTYHLVSVLCGRAVLHHDLGESVLARRDLAEAEALACPLDLGPGSELGTELDDARAALASS